MEDEDCIVVGLTPEEEAAATVEDLWQYTALPEVRIHTTWDGGHIMVLEVVGWE